MGCIQSIRNIGAAYATNSPPPTSSTANGDGGSVKKKRTLPPVPPEDKKIVRALYDFKGMNTDDLPFKKGDRLALEKDDGEPSDWLLATHMKTNKKGYIPSNYVCNDDNSIESQDWWYDFNRRESDGMLMRVGLKKGTFLVRYATDRLSHVLSVRDEDDEGEPCNKHYRIKKMDNGGCYISPKRTFNSMMELIENYQSNSDGLCCLLTDPCPKDRPACLPFRQLEVKRSAIKLENKVGAGYFGEVWKGQFRNAITVAVKTLKTGTMSSESFLEEAKVMHRLFHRRLVNILAVCSDSDPLLIVTEFMPNGSLLHYLRSDEGKRLQFSAIIDMASQIAEGMAFLELKSFIHRDLRADNILVGKNLEVKVADFGLARLIEDNAIYSASENTKFPIKWTAPEAGLYRQFSVKSDVWSFGILLYELITFGRQLYIGMGGNEVLTKVEQGYRLPKPKTNEMSLECPQDYYNIMLSCWKKKPAERPTFQFLFDLFSDYENATENGYQDPSTDIR
ncbi:tyrosine-protein kinase SRK2 [Patella vulgata]|uniref:tyrosine-protein kinase SRK2 n=1 Tax=Patella vulgata TaxID=6465 RepID=UPI0024A83E23|nr:tyrosine-protein kinase SRK2 [Patella vulgata]XP_055956619.1 tyrosine-protein kinase SRK2 [Patella vulgata]